MNNSNKLHTNRVRTTKSTKDQLLDLMRRYNKSRDIEFFIAGFIWFTNVIYNDGYEAITQNYLNTDDKNKLNYTMIEGEIIGTENPQLLNSIISKFASLKKDKLSTAESGSIVKVRNIIAHSNSVSEDLLSLQPNQVIKRDKIKNIIVDIFGSDASICSEFLYTFQNELKRIQDKKSYTDPLLMLFEEIKR